MKTKRHQIRFEDVLWFEGASNYTHIFYNDGSKYVSGYTLSFFEKKYSTSAFFLRIHKSVMINKNYLESFQTEGRNGYVQLTSGQRFEVSRRRMQVLDEFVVND